MSNLNATALHEFLPGMIYRIYSDQRFEVFCGSEELSGYSLSELNSDIDKWLSIVHPDDAARIRQEQSPHDSETACVTTEYRIITRSGDIKWVEERKTPLFSEKGEFLGVQVLVLDIDERKHTEAVIKESETKYRNLVEFSNDFIWEVTVDGVYTYVSPAVEHVLGYTPDQIVGKKPFDLMPLEEAVRVEKGFIMAIYERKPLVRLENVNVHRDGRLITLETSGVPVLNEEGDVIYYRGVDRDITERKQNEVAKERALKELQEALENVKTLRGLLPICSSCKKIRDDDGYWNQIDHYMQTHSLVQFTHGICPDCAVLLYPDYGLYDDNGS